MVLTHHGLEVDVGITSGITDATDHGFMALTPQLPIGNPIPESKNAPIQPILTIGAGIMYKSVDGDGVRGATCPQPHRGTRLGGTGFIIPIYGPLRARVDARMMTTLAREDDKYVSPFVNFEWTADPAAHFGVAKDQDKDGLPDKRDYCPTEPEDIQFEDEDGCPELDNDLDGIPDADDQCVNEAEDVDEWKDDDGCPEPDNDEDGTLTKTTSVPTRLAPPSPVMSYQDQDEITDKDDAHPEAAV